MVLDSMYDAEKNLFEKLCSQSTAPLAPELEEILIGYIETLFTQDQVEQTRTKAAEASAAIAPLARKNKRIAHSLTRAITVARGQERSVSVQQTLDRACNLLGEAS